MPPDPCRGFLIAATAKRNLDFTSSLHFELITRTAPSAALPQPHITTWRRKPSHNRSTTLRGKHSLCPYLIASCADHGIAHSKQTASSSCTSAIKSARTTSNSSSLSTARSTLRKHYATINSPRHEVAPSDYSRIARIPGKYFCTG